MRVKHWHICQGSTVLHSNQKLIWIVTLMAVCKDKQFKTPMHSGLLKQQRADKKFFGWLKFFITGHSSSSLSTEKPSALNPNVLHKNIKWAEEFWVQCLTSEGSQLNSFTVFSVCLIFSNITSRSRRHLLYEYFILFFSSLHIRSQNATYTTIWLFNSTGHWLILLEYLKNFNLKWKNPSSEILKTSSVIKCCGQKNLFTMSIFHKTYLISTTSHLLSCMCIVKGTAEGELLLEKNIMFLNFKYDQAKAESEDSAFMHFDSDTQFILANTRFSFVRYSVYRASRR